MSCFQIDVVVVDVDVVVVVVILFNWVFGVLGVCGVFAAAAPLRPRGGRTEARARDRRGGGTRAGLDDPPGPRRGASRRIE